MFVGFQTQESSRSLDLAIPRRMPFSKCKNTPPRPHSWPKSCFSYVWYLDTRRLDSFWPRPQVWQIVQPSCWPHEKWHRIVFLFFLRAYATLPENSGIAFWAEQKAPAAIPHSAPTLRIYVAKSKQNHVAHCKAITSAHHEHILIWRTAQTTSIGAPLKQSYWCNANTIILAHCIHRHAGAPQISNYTVCIRCGVAPGAD